MFQFRPYIVPLIVYTLLTVIFLWPAIHPAQMTTHLQGLDSRLMASIMEHSSRALFRSDTALANYPIFYPSTESLYLSEAMITPAIIMAPVLHTAGQILASNLWIYLCWWSLAVAVYLLLRSLTFHPLAAFWGGAFIAFCPDRSWHLVGHAHLYFHTGVFLGALALVQMVAPDSKRRWHLLFFLAMLAQAFSGLYISLIALLWSLVAYPALFVFACRQHGCALRPALRRSLPVIAGTFIVIGALYTPLVLGYARYSQHCPNLPLDRISTEAGTLKGYLTPPNIAGRLVTLSGLLTPPDTTGTNWEDVQYPGILGLLVLPASLLLIVITWRKRHAPDRRYAPLMLAVASAAIVCFLFSLGPYINPWPQASRRLPYAFLYDWFPEFRFFRASARFAFGVMWSLGILGAWVLHTIIAHQTSIGRLRGAQVIAATCLSITLLEFYPVQILPTGPVEITDVTRQLQRTGDTAPYVALSLDEGHLLSQVGLHPAPIVNGYSGYTPANRAPELVWFTARFPHPATLALMNQWGVQRVRLGRDDKLTSRLAALDSLPVRYTTIAEDDGSVLIEIDDALPSPDHVAVALRRTHSANDNVLTQPLQIVTGHSPDPQALAQGIRLEWLGMKPRPNHRWQYRGDHATIRIHFSERHPLPAAYSTLTVTYRLTNWYKLKESGIMEWVPLTDNGYTPEHRIDFLVHVDGDLHTVRIPLAHSVPWCASEPLTELRIDLGRQVKNELELHSVRLE